MRPSTEPEYQSDPDLLFAAGFDEVVEVFVERCQAVGVQLLAQQCVLLLYLRANFVDEAFAFRRDSHLELALVVFGAAGTHETPAYIRLILVSMPMLIVPASPARPQRRTVRRTSSSGRNRCLQELLNALVKLKSVDFQ